MYPQKLQQGQAFLFAPAGKALREIRIDEQEFAPLLGMRADDGMCANQRRR